MSLAMLDDQKGTVDSSALLGRLMWYSVPEMTMLAHTDVVNRLKSLGLTKALPVYPEDHNVFRRASKSAERRKVPHNGTTDQFENWMVRDVAGRGEDTICRRIVVEVVDPKGRRLAYEQVADIEYDKKLKSIRFVWMTGFDPTTHPTAHEMMADVAANFHRWKGKLNDQAIREWIRRSIVAMGATSVRPSGGVYFLEERHATQVEALEKFCGEMLPAGGECHSVEIPDNAKQREMVKRAIEAETVGEIERMMTQIREVQKAGNLTPKAYLEMLGGVRSLQNKMNSYTKLLEKDLSAVRTRLKLLDTQTKSLSPLQGQKKRGRKPKQ